jgi:DNA polymerase-3 subunit epsilon
VIRATEEELAAHSERLSAIDKASGGECVWLKPES